MLEREHGSAWACGCGEARGRRTDYVWAAAACGCGGGKHPLLARGRTEAGVGSFTSLRLGTGARARVHDDRGLDLMRAADVAR